MSERLSDGMNYVDDSGDVLPIDRSDGIYVVPNPEDEAWQHSVAVARQLSASEVSESTADEISPQGRLERQHALLDGYGFVADSLDELSRAVALTMDDTLGPGGAMKYVNTIQLHQEYKSTSEDPRAAARSVTSQMGEFAGKSLKDIAFLRLLSETLDSRHPQPQTKILEAVPMLADWRNDAGTKRALTDVLRYVEEREAIQQNTEDKTAENYSKETPELIKRVNDLLANYRIRELRNFIDARTWQHIHQSNFWLDRLQEIEEHATGDVRQIAARALSELQRPE